MQFGRRGFNFTQTRRTVRPAPTADTKTDGDWIATVETAEESEVNPSMGLSDQAEKVGRYATNLLSGKRKLIVGGGAIAVIASLPDSSPWVTVAKALAIGIAAGAHNFAQSKVDAQRELATKPGFDFAKTREGQK